MRVILGSGDQWVSWIHIEDLLRLIDFCVQREEVQGSLNATAPSPVRQRDLAATLANVFGRSLAIRVPARALRWVLGERAQLFVDGQRVVPARAMAAGFSFRFATLAEAARDLLGEAKRSPAPLQIMYDPDCPACDAEMSRYCRDARDAGYEWSFHDVADRPELMQRYGLSTDMARRRVYVLTDQGAMVSGLPAIGLIWANLPRWRLISKLLRVPGVLWLGEALYDRIIAPTIWRGNIVRRAQLSRH
jgi:predicted DCC family thiol-disulfide oxidoreductase YuxK